MNQVTTRIAAILTGLAITTSTSAFAQQPASAIPTSVPQTYLPTPSFDSSSLDATADPCNDFYKFACGNYAANHPIPADQAGANAFYQLYNVNTQELSGILTKAAAGGDTRSPEEQKIGDFYKACMDTDAIEQRGLAPIQDLLKEIDSTSLRRLPTTIGHLQRMGITVFFSYGEQQDFKDASKQIASIDQGGLGMPEKDYYLRTGAKDEQFRKDYVEHVAKMLTLGGSTPQQAAKDAAAIMTLETEMAKASMGVTERRDPDKIYHIVPVATMDKLLPFGMYEQFEDAAHSPRVAELNDASPDFIVRTVALARSTDIATLRAYMRYHLLSAVATNLPKRFDDENFSFYATKLTGTQSHAPRWKRCSGRVDAAVGEALGKVYVQQYFAGDSKAKTLQMVHDIEAAMDHDLDQLDWMSPETKVKAKEKLHLVANKIGYPDKFRDYTTLAVKPDDPVGNQLRAAAFESDRELARIGKPVDPNEWDMTPPTVNAYYNSSMNDINFPAGILQPSFYDPKVDDAVNYGHIGAIIGHELTHGFDDEGKKFDGHGNLADWWTPEDTKQFEAKTGCLADEYSSFTAVDDVHVNGRLTLGENTADNGGLVLAYMAYLDRAAKQNVDLTAKIDGYTPAQRFYIGYAQNYCANERPDAVRAQVLTDPHSPPRFRANGAIVNQPGFSAAFSCKKGTPMVPVQSCRVW
ncbi:M13 family metallopeptidase [Granulicella sp. WH15]|uniref:M13 family metallopeptidase n=1 Tax=Granulicella sp. WH15 TaxID=2602070 RepID=UPI001366F350|nr:M13 family metallopeptidase [Granulicella sp. WH15]QHN04841.1 M13 family metallopeptidase [Granulicella sp. WH15]